MRNYMRCDCWGVRCLRPLSLLLMISLAVLQIGCGMVYSLRAEKAAEDALKTLAVPAGGVLLSELERPSYGSDDRCTAAHRYRLYGTQLSFGEVVSFYRERLVADGWHEEDGLSSSAWFSPTGHLRLVVSSDADSSGAPAETIEEGRGTYATLYCLTLTYMTDPSCYHH
jgi:hypothetical protein